MSALSILIGLRIFRKDDMFVWSREKLLDAFYRRVIMSVGEVYPTRYMVH